MDALVFFVLFVAALVSLVLFIVWSSRQRRKPLPHQEPPPIPAAPVSAMPLAPAPVAPKQLTQERAARLWAKRREWLDEMLYMSKRSKYSDPIDEDSTFCVGYSDDEFEEELVGTFHPVHFFPVTLAGISHPNEDGSRRDVIVAMCRELDLLRLQHVESEFSETAVAVLRDDGLQLGFLPDRIGAEILSKLRNGWLFSAVFRKPHFHPERKVVVGAAIYIFQLGKPEASPVGTDGA